MPGLNFKTQAVTCEYVEITSRSDLQWRLRDDVPTDTMMRYLSLAEIAAVQPGDESTDIDKVREMRYLWERYVEEILHLCGEIFRWTYPETTDEELRQEFSHDEREQIVQLFFSLRSARLSKQRDDMEQKAKNHGQDAIQPPKP